MEQPMQRDAGNGIADATPAPCASRTKSWSRKPKLIAAQFYPSVRWFVSRPTHIMWTKFKRLRTARPQCTARFSCGNRRVPLWRSISTESTTVCSLCFSRGDTMARAFGNRSTGMRWIGFTRRGDLGPCPARQINGFDKRRAGLFRDLFAANP